MDMPAQPGIPKDCSRILGVLDAVNDKWSFPVMLTLRDRPYRFNDLRRAIGGISHQMLTRSVRALERDGVISRRVYATVPPQVEYALTPLGRSLFHSAAALGEWARDHIEEIEGNRRRHDVLTKKGGFVSHISYRK